jgi:hypothetical protein
MQAKKNLSRVLGRIKRKNEAIAEITNASASIQKDEADFINDFARITNLNDIDKALV